MLVRRHRERMSTNPFRYFKTSPEVIQLAVMTYVRSPLSLRNVEDLLHERGIELSHETVRYWWNRFGPMFAAAIRRKRASRLRTWPQWQWHLDEVFVRIDGVTHYLWRAVDHEGDVLEARVTKRPGSPASVDVSAQGAEAVWPAEGRRDGPDSVYRATLKQPEIEDDEEVGRWLNNRAENSHFPLRRPERAMLRVRQMRSLQKFAAIHSSVHNHFNLDRHLNPRDRFKENRQVALAEWRQLAA